MVKTLTLWAATWEKQGWKRKAGPVENLDLVQARLRNCEAAAVGSNPVVISRTMARVGTSTRTRSQRHTSGRRSDLAPQEQAEFIAIDLQRSTSSRSAACSSANSMFSHSRAMRSRSSWR